MNQLVPYKMANPVIFAGDGGVKNKWNPGSSGTSFVWWEKNYNNF